MKTKQVNIRLSEQMKADMQSLADAEHRSLSNYIELVLIEHMKKRITREPAMTAADASN